MREKILEVTCLALAGVLAMACASEDPPAYFGGGYDAGSAVVSTPGSSGGGTGEAVSGSGGAAGALGRRASAGASSRFSGSGGSAETVDSGDPCPNARPENRSSCAVSGLRCRYRVVACSCVSGAWNCND